MLHNQVGSMTTFAMGHIVNASSQIGVINGQIQTLGVDPRMNFADLSNVVEGVAHTWV